MLMDLSCPVDLLATEILRDSSGRAQVYLDFRSLSAAPVTGLWGDVYLLDGEGAPVAQRPLSARALRVDAYGSFSLCVRLDDLPDFTEVTVAVRCLGFEGAEDWQEDPEEWVHCAQEALPAGPDRVALVAVMGRDAVCFPRSFENAWRCVCGRFNLPTLGVCVRCGREREELMTHCRPEKIRVLYAAQERSGASPFSVAPAFSLDQARRSKRRKKAFAQRKKRFHRLLLLRRAALAALAVGLFAAGWWLL